ncbi:MAG TPA: LPS export ABC transporter periplasmic protein LptC [Gallionella sp.]|jgi:lipopolysaccharide export system protein LptC|nr:LPS export ABC transporter periplasmic protein LptC [Gallionella sp.]OGR06481.1 MAG: LPS export ABC transporter periplasmic protein LptC [Deltaproteobacteria bacterium RIFOXYD12_FULL_50_9]OGS66354.1 MAG: LPS export ABC transporter periplasmic protein LptC [Gallionellales bacterium GWA2_54_124]OGT33286.1 MAG: LPS export ABC transporter periplasmic protein LptC [Gallionellales bacterium RIFOXYD2_FULL_52_7]HCI52684.1 LPS export ABC transporter periplasmic protein LptC [Gallionella sp.]
MIFVSRYRYWLPLLPLLVLLAGVYWLDKQVQQEIAVAANNQRHDPDGIMDNFHATKMDLQGEPRFLLSAKQMRHYPDHDTTELDLPRVTMLSSERPPLYVNGNRGNVSSRGDEVLFHEAVVVRREAGGDQSAMTLKTEYLRVLPNQDWANTDRPVTMVNLSNTVHAIGLEMDNKARTMKLLSHVRSEHHVK